jgi:cytochrome P450
MSTTRSGESNGQGGSGDLEAVWDIFDFTAPQPRYQDLVAKKVVELPGIMTLAASRSAVNEVLRHHERFSAAGSTLYQGNVRPLIPLMLDPPAHVKYRKVLDPLFAPKKMDASQERIAGRVNHFIDKFIDRGECDFSEEFAELFPSSVFLELMGLPWEDLDTLIRLRDGIMGEHPDVTADKRNEMLAANGQEIYNYFNAVLDERQRAPKDDILSQFLATRIDGELITREEILDICFLFLTAGLDTVRDSLTCMFAFLARNPDHRRQIVDDPSVISNAVEELLRWESPVPVAIPRKVIVDTEIEGTQVPAGSMVTVLLGAANVDPAGFSDSMDVRFDRESNPHIAFGGGVHRCLGSHLARRELRMTLREWHRRIPEYGIKPGHEDLVYSTGLRRVKNLTLVWPLT